MRKIRKGKWKQAFERAEHWLLEGPTFRSDVYGDLGDSLLLGTICQRCSSPYAKQAHLEGR